MHCRADIGYYQGSYVLLTDDVPDTAIVFVHGFAGNAVTTWVDFHAQIDGRQYGPAFKKTDVFFYSYDSTANFVWQSANRLGNFIEHVVGKMSKDTLRLWLPQGRDWSKVAKQVLDEKMSRTYSKVLLVGHSLGGVVIRKLVLKCVDKERDADPIHPLLENRSPVLFAPAIKGFIHGQTVAQIVSLATVISVGFVIWVLRRGKVYTQLLEGSSTLVDLEKFTEEAFASNALPGLAARIYFGVDEEIVTPGKYKCDKQKDKPDRRHVDICKPSSSFDDPVKWVIDGLK